MNETIKRIVDEFEHEVIDDDVGFWQVVRRAEELILAGDDRNVRTVTFDLVRRMLSRGLCVREYLGPEKGWERWPDQTPDSVIRRIEAEWDALGGEPDLGDVCWFSK